MWVSSLELSNIKSFATSGTISLDRKMNIFIGPNNSGKSIIIKSLYLLQNKNSLDGRDLRCGKNHGEIKINLEDVTDDYYQNTFGINNYHFPQIKYTFNKDGLINVATDSPQGSQHNVSPIIAMEPSNFIYTFLSKRKVTEYEHVVNKDKAERISDNFAFLVSKVDRISKPQYVYYKEFEQATKDIIGFTLSTIHSIKGHEIGVPLGRTGGIAMERMGEGIPNLLGLITDLCGAENKLFIIEEPENDIHPKALKALLDFIIKKSEVNQFVVTTHSNIVLRYLGSIEDAKLYRVGMYFNPDGIPTSGCKLIENTPEARRFVLEELGYEMTDYDLWKGWLILEESTAERLINDFFIPTYFPELKGKLRTVSSQGVQEAKSKFQDFQRLFLFIHLAQSYRNRAWVVVDNGEKGSDLIQELKDTYCKSGWNESQFRTLSKKSFEEYYPSRFDADVCDVLQMPHGKEKQSKKSDLMKKVLEWAEKNQADAKKEFQEKASEVISLLDDIKKAIS